MNVCIHSIKFKENLFILNRFLVEVIHSNDGIDRSIERIFLGALPKEQGRFRGVDKEFRDIMAEIASNPRLVIFAQRKDLSNMLKSMLDQLGRCQKALNELLEVRKFSLPSFFRSFLLGKTFDLSSILLHW